jgi:shikimate kinase
MLPSITLSEQNLILTGYTGPNQPAVGRQIAERLKMPFVNIDMHIEERMGMTGDELRARFGESRLKIVEAEIMGEAVLRRSSVIRVSGRTLLQGDYYRALQENGHIICLIAKLNAVLQRLHLALGARFHNPHERALALGHLKSEWAVRSLEGIHELDITYKSAEETVETVVALWQKLAIRRG